MWTDIRFHILCFNASTPLVCVWVSSKSVHTLLLLCFNTSTPVCVSQQQECAHSAVNSQHTGVLVTHVSLHGCMSQITVQRKASTMLCSGSPQDSTSMYQASLEHAWCVCTIQLEGVVHCTNAASLPTAHLNCVGGAAYLIPTWIDFSAGASGRGYIDRLNVTKWRQE